MLLTEIKEEVVVGRSGQFILDPENLEVDDPKFLILVRSCLRKYNRHVPFNKKVNITITGSTHTFLEEDAAGGIPDWVAGVMPIQSSGGFGVFQAAAHSSYAPGPLVKRQFAYDYRKPTLYLPWAGVFDVNKVRNHVITKNDDDKDQIATFGMEGEDEDSFFALLTGRFLMTIGRYRRAFTIGEIPITMDASELVSEGQEMSTLAEEDMQENQAKFYLAGWGN